MAGEPGKVEILTRGARTGHYARWRMKGETIRLTVGASTALISATPGCGALSGIDELFGNGGVGFV